MIISPRNITIKLRTFEIALLLVFLEEISRNEETGYLSGFADYVANGVLRDALISSIPVIYREHLLEQTAALLSDIRDGGYPFGDI